MTVSISLSENAERRLSENAKAEGTDLPTFVSRIVEQQAQRLPLPSVPGAHPDQATLDLLKKWEEEDRTDDPEEIARRQRETEEFMRNLAQNRIDSEGPNARKLWP